MLAGLAQGTRVLQSPPTPQPNAPPISWMCLVSVCPSPREGLLPCAIVPQQQQCTSGPLRRFPAPDALQAVDTQHLQANQRLSMLWQDQAAKGCQHRFH